MKSIQILILACAAIQLSWAAPAAKHEENLDDAVLREQVQTEIPRYARSEGLELELNPTDSQLQTETARYAWSEGLEPEVNPTDNQIQERFARSEGYNDMWQVQESNKMP